MLLASLVLAVSVSVLGAASPASAGTGRLVRLSLDDERAELAPPKSARIIRSSLDDPSHREFPLEEPVVRLIRISLDENNACTPLEPSARRERHLRTSLD